MSSIVAAFVSVSAIAAIGFVAGRWLQLEHRTLAQLALYVLAPALIADKLYRTTLSLQSALGLLAGFAAVSGLLYLLVWGISRLLSLSLAREKELVAIGLFSNAGNLGLPFVAFTLGDAGLERAAIYLVASAIALFGLGPAFLQGAGLARGLTLVLRLPLFWAMLVGLALNVAVVELPLQLGETLRQLGQAAIPVALIVLGMQLATTRLAVGAYELAATGLRLLVAPLMAYLVAQGLALAPLDTQVLVLQSGMPVAVNSVVLVSEFGGDPSEVARIVALSTLVSPLTLTLAFALTSPHTLGGFG